MLEPTAQGRTIGGICGIKAERRNGLLEEWYTLLRWSGNPARETGIWKDKTDESYCYQ